MVKDIQQTAAGPELQGGARELPRRAGAVDFARLYQMYSRRVYKRCWQMVWDKADAEDLTQEVFIHLFRKIDSYRGEAAFTTWLYRLTVNVVLMRLRKKTRIQLALGEGTERGEALKDAAAELGTSDTALSGTIDRLNLERALAQLPAGYRMVFLLHDVEGYEHEEIAQILGVGAGTSKSQLHKARLRLRALLRGTTRQRSRAAAGRLSQVTGSKIPTQRDQLWGEGKQINQPI